MSISDNPTLVRIRDLHQRARTRNGVAQVIDQTQNMTLGQLDALDRAYQAGGMSRAQATEAWNRTASDHIDLLQRIVDAPDAQLGNILYPQPVQPTLSPETLAAQVITQLGERGILLSADHAGRLEARPMASLTMSDRELLMMLRPDIVSALRADVFTIEAGI